MLTRSFLENVYLLTFHSAFGQVGHNALGAGQVVRHHDLENVPIPIMIFSTMLFSAALFLFCKNITSASPTEVPMHLALLANRILEIGAYRGC